MIAFNVSQLFMRVYLTKQLKSYKNLIASLFLKGVVVVYKNEYKMYPYSCKKIVGIY